MLNPYISFKIGYYAHKAMKFMGKYCWVPWILAVIIALLIFNSCATTKVQTKIEDPEGQVWTLLSKSDAVVEIKRPDGTIVKVDNRGKPTFFETYMHYLLIKAAPSVELSNQPRED